MQPVWPIRQPQVGRCESRPASDPLGRALAIRLIEDIIEARQFGENLLSPGLQLRQSLLRILAWTPRLPAVPPAMSRLAHVPYLCAQAVTAIRAVSAPAVVYVHDSSGTTRAAMRRDYAGAVRRAGEAPRER